MARVTVSPPITLRSPLLMMASGLLLPVLTKMPAAAKLGEEIVKSPVFSDVHWTATKSGNSGGEVQGAARGNVAAVDDADRTQVPSFGVDAGHRVFTHSNEIAAVDDGDRTDPEASISLDGLDLPT